MKQQNTIKNKISVVIFNIKTLLQINTIKKENWKLNKLLRLKYGLFVYEKRRLHKEHQKLYLINYPLLQVLCWEGIYYVAGDILRENEPMCGGEYAMYPQDATESLVSKMINTGNLYIPERKTKKREHAIEIKEIDKIKYFNNNKIRNIPIFSKKKQNIYQEMNAIWYLYDIEKKDFMYVYADIKLRNILTHIFFVISVIGTIILCYLLRRLFRVFFLQQTYYMIYIIKTIKVQVLFFNIEDLKTDIIVLYKEFKEYIKTDITTLYKEFKEYINNKI